MVSALKKAEERYVDDLRSALREKKVRYLTVTRLESGGLEVRFPRRRRAATRGAKWLRRQLPELGLVDGQKGDEYFLLARLTEQSHDDEKRQVFRRLGPRKNHLSGGFLR